MDPCGTPQVTFIHSELVSLCQGCAKTVSGTHSLILGEQNPVRSQQLGGHLRSSMSESIVTIAEGRVNNDHGE